MSSNNLLAGDFKLRLKHTLLFLSLLTVGLLISCSPPPAPTPTIEAAAAPTEEATPETTPDVLLTCDDLITSAIEHVGTVCSGLGNNQACYGNSMIEVEFREGAEGSFNSTGDIVDLLDIRRLSARSLSQSQQLWGIAVLKAHAAAVRRDDAG